MLTAFFIDDEKLEVKEEVGEESDGEESGEVYFDDLKLFSNLKIKDDVDDVDDVAANWSGSFSVAGVGSQT